MGMFTLLKNGGPTLIFSPRKPSESNGSKVPHNTAKAAPRSMRLLNRNADSRDKNDSIWFSLRSCGHRHATSTTPSAIRLPMNPRKMNAIFVFSANVCTDSMSPERVRKVAKMVSTKVRITSPMFQTLSIPRFSWIWMEWRNAVAERNGSNEAFSTGSQNQYPPHPSSS